jgi:hypothetical protein
MLNKSNHRENKPSSYKLVISSLTIIYFLMICFQLVKVSHSCDIVGASACPHKPENDLKEENLDEYCEKYKQNLECVFKKYSGCDKREKYVEAMESMVRGLRKRAKQIERLCEIDINIPEEKPKQVNNSQDVRHNGHTTRKIVTTSAPCKINSISPDCYPILTNVQFNPTWNGVLKQKWCNSANAYYNCIKVRLQNCLGVQYIESVGYYEKIQKYVHSQANINCPGGLEGCAGNPNDVRCKMGVKYGETSKASSTFYYSNSFLYFLIQFMIWCWCF